MSASHPLCEWPRGCDRYAHHRHGDFRLCKTHHNFASAQPHGYLHEMESGIALTHEPERVPLSLAEKWRNRAAGLGETHGGECFGEALL